MNINYPRVPLRGEGSCGGGGAPRLSQKPETWDGFWGWPLEILFLWKTSFWNPLVLPSSPGPSETPDLTHVLELPPNPPLSSPGWNSLLRWGVSVPHRAEWQLGCSVSFHQSGPGSTQPVSQPWSNQPLAVMSALTWDTAVTVADAIPVQRGFKDWEVGSGAMVLLHHS